MVLMEAPLERAQCSWEEGKRSGCAIDFPLVTLKHRFRHSAFDTWLPCTPNRLPRPPEVGGASSRTREEPVV